MFPKTVLLTWRMLRRSWVVIEPIGIVILVFMNSERLNAPGDVLVCRCGGSAASCEKTAYRGSGELLSVLRYCWLNLICIYFRKDAIAVWLDFLTALTSSVAA